MVRNSVTTATAVNLSLITLQENQFTKRLAGVAALVAVPTMIAGIYGMNFRHMPELGWTFGYPFAIALMVGVAGALYVVFKKHDWL